MKINLDKQTVDLIEDVKIDISYLSSADYQKVFRLFAANGKLEEINPSEIVANAELLEVAKEILPKYCSNIKGIELEEKGKTRDAKVEDLINIGGLLQFVPLALAQLFSASSMTHAEKEGLKKQ